MLATLAGLSVAAFSADQPLTYIVFPALIWAALRLGPQGLGKPVPDLKPEEPITGGQAVAIGHEVLGDLFPAMRGE
jgi:hypothetical protein